MDKKGGFGLFMIFFIIFIAIIVIFVILGTKNGWINTQSPNEEIKTKLLFNFIDYDNGNLINNIDYCIYSKIYNPTQCGNFSQGYLSQAIVSENNTYITFGKNLYYYSDNTTTNYDLVRKPQVSYSVKLKKKANISLSYIGNITDDQSILNFIVNVDDGYLEKPFICLEWSSSIIYARIYNQTLNCNSNWRNWTIYHKENFTYDYLPTGKYYCDSTNDLEFCDSVNYNNCYLGKIEYPKRYSKRADSCYDIQGEYQNSILNISINIKSYFPNDADYIKVIFGDREKEISSKGISFEYETSDGNDNGIKDSSLQINYSFQQ